MKLSSVLIAGVALVGLGAAAPATRTAVFAGGCFWSVEHDLENIPGVKDVVVGYAGGARPNPTYDNHQGHLEAVRVTYDPAKVSYAQLVDGFFHRIDPTDARGQFCDYGPSYRTAVFTASAEERRTAEAVKARVSKVLGRPVATMVLPAAAFWKGEAYHQDYARKNPLNYNAYRIGCGRDAKLRAVWAGR